MKDPKTILLIVVSACLIGSWVFHIYDKSKYATVPSSLVVSDKTDDTKLNDSIQLLYRTTVAQLENVIVGKDSLNKELQQKATEIDTLRTEITSMLNETTITKEDLKRALMKIQELQVKINQYNARQSNQSVSTASGSTTTTTVPLKTQQNSTTAEPSFQGGEMIIQAVKSNNAENEQHFNVSFQLKNSNAIAGSTSVFVIVRDPSGNTIQDDEWIAGVFETKNEGNKKYSRRINWEFAKNEGKRFTTTVPVKTFTNGTYQLQVYCNGTRVGKTDLVLN